MNRTFLPLSLALVSACGSTPVDFDGYRMHDYVPFDAVRTWTYQATDTSILATALPAQLALDSGDTGDAGDSGDAGNSGDAGDAGDAGDSGTEGPPYLLVAKQNPEFETSEDGPTIHTIQFTLDCFGRTGICADGDDEDTKPDREGEAVFSWKISSDSRNGVLFHAYVDEGFEQFPSTEYDPAVVMAANRMTFNDSEPFEAGGVSWTTTFAAEEPCPAPGQWPDEEDRPSCLKMVLEAESGTHPFEGTFWIANTLGVAAFQLESDGVLWGLYSYEVQSFSDF